jgi:prevent-host-death family protein
MKKAVTAMEARRNFGNMLNEVSLKGDMYIINRAGKPIAAVVSVAELQRMERSEAEGRKEFFAWVDEMRGNFKGTGRKEAGKLADDAVAWARKQTA